MRQLVTIPLLIIFSIDYRYCCPECEFQTKVLEQFGDHAKENHTKSFVLFKPVVMKVELSEPMTQNENTLPDIGQAVIDQFIPVDIKHEDESTFNEALKVVQKEKGKEILDGDHERNLSSMEANSEPVNDVLQEMILPTNSQSVSYEDKLPDDFDIYMIDPTLNTLMCSKRDLAVNHKLGVFTELTVREILNPYKIKIFQDIKITVNSHDSVTCELG